MMKERKFGVWSDDRNTFLWFRTNMTQKTDIDQWSVR